MYRTLDAAGFSIGATSRILNDCDQHAKILEILYFLAEKLRRQSTPAKNFQQIFTCNAKIHFRLATDDVRLLEFL